MRQHWSVQCSLVPGRGQWTGTNGTEAWTGGSVITGPREESNAIDGSNARSIEGSIPESAAESINGTRKELIDLLSQKYNRSIDNFKSRRQNLEEGNGSNSKISFNFKFLFCFVSA